MANRWERWGKAILEAPLHLFPNRPAPALPPPPGEIRRILLIRPDERIGNLVLLTPMIDAIRREWPDARLDLMVGGAMAPLVSGDPRFAELIVFDKRALVRNPLRLGPLWRRVASRRYDLAIDASHPHKFSLTSGLAAWASGARWRLGYREGAAHRLLNCGLTLEPGVHEHLTDVYIQLLRVVAPAAENRGLRFLVTPAEVAEARDRLVAAGVPLEGRRLIGVHVGGRGTKRWPIEDFVELLRRLGEEADLSCAVFHGPGEGHLLAAIPPGLAHMAPSLPLRLFAAALSQCDLFISGDTGPMHLAAAVGAPTLALFLHGNAGVFGPQDKPHRILHRPEGLTPAEVAAAAREMLAGSASTADPSGTGSGSR